jgi:hypothetical protein
MAMRATRYLQVSVPCTHEALAPWMSSPAAAEERSSSPSRPVRAAVPARPPSECRHCQLWPQGGATKAHRRRPPLALGCACVWRCVCRALHAYRGPSGLRGHRRFALCSTASNTHTPSCLTSDTQLCLAHAQGLLEASRQTVARSPCRVEPHRHPAQPADPWLDSGSMVKILNGEIVQGTCWEGWGRCSGLTSRLQPLTSPSSSCVCARPDDDPRLQRPAQTSQSG